MTTSSSASSSATGSGGVGGANDPWKLLYDGTPDRQPGAIALLPTGIVVEVASDAPGHAGEVTTLPYAGGALGELAPLPALLSTDPCSLSTDDASLAILVRRSGVDELSLSPVGGGAPVDLIAASAMKRAHPLVAVRGGSTYFVDDAGIERIASGGQPAPFVAMPIAAVAASESHVFFQSGTTISAIAFGGGPIAHVADEQKPIIAMAATGTHAYWLEDAGDGKHSTVFGADVGGAGAKLLGSGEFHAIAADSTGVYAFFFDGDERAVLVRIDPATGSGVSIDSPFSSISSLAVRGDVPYVVALGTVLTQDAPNVFTYHREVRALPK